MDRFGFEASTTPQRNWSNKIYNFCFLSSQYINISLMWLYGIKD